MAIFYYFQMIDYVKPLPLPAQSPQLLGYPPIYIPKAPLMPIYNFDSIHPFFKPSKPFFPFPISTFLNMDTVKNAVPQKGRKYDGVAISTFINSKGEGASQIAVNHDGQVYHESCKI